MSYRFAPALQQAVFAHLTADPDVTALAGGNVFDMPPAGPVPLTYVSLGSEEVADRSDQSARGAEHRLVVSVVTQEAGFLAAKQLAAAVTGALDGAAPVLALAQGHLVSLRFDRARARRIDQGLGRQVDLTFRARVDDNS